MNDIDKNLIKNWRENANIPNTISDEQIIAIVNQHSLYDDTRQCNSENRVNLTILRQQLGLGVDIVDIQLTRNQVDIVRNGNDEEIKSEVLEDILEQADLITEKWGVRKARPSGIGMVCSACKNDTFRIYYSKHDHRECWEFECTKCGDINIM